MKLFCDLYGFLYGVSFVTSRHLDTEFVHRVLELYSVLASLDGVYLYTDYLDIVLIKYACLGQLGTKIET